MAMNLFNFYLDDENKKLLKSAATAESMARGRKGCVSMGDVLNALIQQKLADPLKLLEKQRMFHVEELLKVKDKIDQLHHLKEGDKKEKREALNIARL